MIYDTRWDFVRKYVKARRVLDIGPAELVGTINRDKMTSWLHLRISNLATEVTGLEQSPEQVQQLRKLGFDIQEGDAETFELDKTFETIVAGELIEHLSNPGRFLDKTRAHLGDGGILVLTTPNRFSFQSIYKILRTGSVPAYSKPLAKHVVYFDSDSMSSLLERHGFEILELSYCRWVADPSRSRSLRILVGLATRFRPMLSSTLLVAATRAHHEIPDLGER